MLWTDVMDRCYGQMLLTDVIDRCYGQKLWTDVIVLTSNIKGTKDVG
jgi:hypothetical protein